MKVSRRSQLSCASWQKRYQLDFANSGPRSRQGHAKFAYVRVRGTRSWGRRGGAEGNACTDASLEGRVRLNQHKKKRGQRPRPECWIAQEALPLSQKGVGSDRNRLTSTLKGQKATVVQHFEGTARTGPINFFGTIFSVLTRSTGSFADTGTGQHTRQGTNVLRSGEPKD